MKAKLFVAATSLLAGCTSMLTHYRYSDPEIIGQARSMALVMTCVENGLVDAAVGYSFAHVVTDMHSIAVYNRDLYEKNYQDSRNYFSKYSSSQYSAECEKFSDQAPSMVPLMRTKYEETMRQRQRDLTGMSQSFNSLGMNAASGTTYTPISMPSGKVTFGQEKSKQSTNNFLINTNNGHRQCSVSESGYVICR